MAIASQSINQSINQCYICSNEFIKESCQPFTKNHLFVLTFSTSPSATTTQIAIDGSLEHPQ
jgi:hypothetical protein